MESITTVPNPPPRPDDAHKGTFGTVIVVGGCPTMLGAPALAASAALRAGVGLAKIAAPAGVLPFTIAIEPGATGIVLPIDPTDTVATIEQADPLVRAVLAVGPGMGRGDTGPALIGALLDTDRPVVLDADGLNHLAAGGQVRTSMQPALVMTPHPGEFRRLAQPLGIEGDPTDAGQRPGLAAQLAVAHHAVVVLKGHHTIVTDGARVYTNQTGNPALSTAGTGDVLTGLIAALIAQAIEPLEAAVLGVYLHGLAADLWRAGHGPSGLTARDLVTLLPQAFESMR